MDKFWMIAIPLFVVITFLLWKVSIGYYKKESSEKMWKQWGVRTMYWEGVVIVSSGVTVLIMLLLKWGNVLTF